MRHKFVPFPLAGRPICENCSLLRLKNLLTDWAVEKGCEFREHPGYKEALRTLPELHRRRQDADLLHKVC